MMKSSNGIDWEYVNGAPSIALQDIVWSPELSLLVVVLLSEITASAIYTSSDAITWTSRTNGINWDYIAQLNGLVSGQNIIWADDRFVAVYQIGSHREFTSLNGINWTKVVVSLNG